MNRNLLIFFFVLLFAIASFLRVDFFFTIVYLLVGAYLLSRLWTSRTVDGIEIRRQLSSERAFHGDLVDVELKLQNGRWLPVPWLELTESLPLALASPPSFRRVLSLTPREQQRFGYTLECRRRGYYSIGPLRLRTGDMLGFHRQIVLEVEPSYLTVYPRVLHLHKLGLPTHSPLVALAARTPLFEDPARIMGVREYQRGDSPRRIHWTATARAGKLLVKQYQPAISRETMIFLNLDQSGYEQSWRFDASEQAIVVAASLANHIIVNDGLAAGLATAGFDPGADQQARFALPPRSGRGQLIALLELLARLQLGQDQSFADLLRHESLNLAWGTTLLVISGKEDQALVDILASLRRSGFAIAMILIQRLPPSRELAQRARMVDMQLHHIWRDQDLEHMS